MNGDMRSGPLPKRYRVADQDWGLALLLSAAPTDRALSGWVAPSISAEQWLRVLAEKHHDSA